MLDFKKKQAERPESYTVIRFAGTALGQPTNADGQYLESFDFEYDNGRGIGKFTRNVKHALHFKDAGEALTFWRTTPKCHPIRMTDGQPNRPLTAYNVEFIPIDANTHQPLFRSRK
jgi:hypothetical protein